MGTQIRIFRKKAAYGAGAPLEIVLDGETVTTIKNGEELTIETEKRPSRIAFLSTGYDYEGVVLQEVECLQDGDVYIELGFNMGSGQLDILGGNVRYENIAEKSKNFIANLFLVRLACFIFIVSILVIVYFLKQQK